jgi:hypothetical protein
MTTYYKLNFWFIEWFECFIQLIYKVLKIPTRWPIYTQYKYVCNYFLCCVTVKHEPPFPVRRVHLAITQTWLKIYIRSFVQVTFEDICIFIQLHLWHCRVYTLCNNTLSSNLQEEGTELSVCKTSEGTSYLSEQHYGREVLCVITVHKP